MSSELKVCIVSDEKNLEKMNKAEEVEKGLINEHKNIKITKFNNIDQNISNISKIKPMAYIFVIDDIEELNSYYERLKKPECSILITENLHTDFILGSIEMTSEIIYGGSDIKNIVERIIKHVFKFQKVL